jgi:hypothetical protein
MANLIKHYGKLIRIYDLENNILIKVIDKKEKDKLANNKNYVLCFKIKKKYEGFLHNDLNIAFEKFPWRTYYKINRELISTNKNNNTKLVAWNHWIHYGKKEERAFSYINNTNDHRARFGNLFFLNMCLHLFSEKYDLRSSYKYEKQFNQLGITFYKGKLTYNRNLLLTDHNFVSLLESNVSPQNIIINNSVWFHTRRFCEIMKEYFLKNNLFEKVFKKNYFKHRYNNNNDLFIHVRLGDVTSKTEHLYDYYTKTIKSLKFNQGYISSDNINHSLCQNLIKNFNLFIINKSEIETIMFASTCNNIILSGGTFSWLIAFLALKSENIFYPELKEKWFGDIFSFTDWKGIKT